MNLLLGNYRNKMNIALWRNKNEVDQIRNINMFVGAYSNWQ